MTQAPIALVAALRETSVVFARHHGGVLSGGASTRLRVASIVTVAAGAVADKDLLV